MKDKRENTINLGDILISDDNYSVIVRERTDNHRWYGKLICEPSHSCADIPYALNDGRRYIRVANIREVINCNG